jgi:hypothetical protein
MMWKLWKKGGEREDASKAKVQKVSKPKDIPEPVGRYLIVELGQNPDWVWHLKSVMRPRQEEKDCYDVRVFDEGKAAQKNVTVKDYTSLDEHPELILYEGWFDKRSYKVEIEEKKISPLTRAA